MKLAVWHKTYGLAIRYQRRALRSHGALCAQAEEAKERADVNQLQDLGQVTELLNSASSA